MGCPHRRRVPRFPSYTTWGSEARRDRAAKYLVAHLATIRSWEGTSTGDLQSETVGAVSRTYSSGGSAGSASSLEATTYGAEYRRLLRQTCIRMAVL